MPLRVSPSGSGMSLGVGAPSKSPFCRSRLTLATGLSLLLLVLVGSTLLVRLSLEESGATLEGYGAGGGPPGTAALNAPPGSFAHRLRSSWKVLTNLATQPKRANGATSGGWGSNESGAAAAVARIPNAGDAAASAYADAAAAGAPASSHASSSPSFSAPLLAVPRPQRKIASARDAAARHAAEVAAAAAIAPPHPPAVSKLAEFDDESAAAAAPATVSVPAHDVVEEEQTSSLSGALAFVRDALRGPGLPITPAGLLQPGTGAAPAVAPHPTPSQGLRLALDHLAGRAPPAPGSTLSPASARAPGPLVVPAAPGPDSPLHGLVVATRFWASNDADLESLQRFLERTLPHVERVLVALNVERDRADTLGFLAGLELPSSRVRVVAVTPWLGVSSALNALALSAAQLNASRVLFQSVEVSLSEAQLRALVHEFDSRPDQLVVGPVLDGHAFEETRPRGDGSDDDDDAGLAGLMHDPEPLSSVGVDDTTSHEIDGHNAPWNTAALWHLPTLLQTGFLTVADGFPRGLHQYGQEEVPTINLLQALATGAATHRYARRTAGGGAANGGASAGGSSGSSVGGAADLHRGRVTLLHVGDVSWTHSFASASARKEWHEQKRRSKLARAAHHMSVLGAGLHPGRVEHRIARVHHDKPQQHAKTHPKTHQQARTQIMLTDTSIQHETQTHAQSHAQAADPHSAAALAPTSMPLSSSSLAASSLLESAAAASLDSPLVDGSSVTDGAPLAPPPTPIPTRRVKRSALHGLRARGAGLASSSAGVDRDRDAHAADEPMHVKIKRHIPIGR